jgi:hypothetical protein
MRIVLGYEKVSYRQFTTFIHSSECKWCAVDRFQPLAVALLHSYHLLKLGRRSATSNFISFSACHRFFPAVCNSRQA